MSNHVVLIDGYNVIRRSPPLALAEAKSLEHGRNAFIKMLAARHSARAGDMTVVFDGAERTETRSMACGIRIVFSAQGCTADDCIVRLAAEAHARGQQVTVATDDAGIHAALAKALPTTHTTSAKTLGQDLYAPDRTRAKQYRHRQAIQAKMAADQDPADHAHPKSGNPRRAPRAKR